MDKFIQISYDDEIFLGNEILRLFAECTICGLCCQEFKDIVIYPEEITTLDSAAQISTETFKNNFYNLPGHSVIHRGMDKLSIRYIRNVMN